MLIVGGKIEEFKGVGNEGSIAITGDMVYIFLCYEGVTEEEEELVARGEFELSCTLMQHIIDFQLSEQKTKRVLVEMVYNPHMSKAMVMEELETYPLVLTLVESKTGEIKLIRFLSLTEDFTARIRGAIKEEQRRSFDESEYERAIELMWRVYTPKSLSERAFVRCELRGGVLVENIVYLDDLDLEGNLGEKEEEGGLGEG